MDYKFETRCIHRENEHEEGHPYGSVCTPIYQTATFYHPGIGQTTGFNYTRESNPTRTELEDIVTSLEEAKDTVACANGMAAIVLCMELFESGDHIVCSEDLYGGSVRMFQTTGEKRGLTFTYVNTAYAAATEAAIKSNTKALYIETPSNPTMQITDLAKMKSLADKYNLLIIVDNTFLSPYFQKPIRFGADLVIHSGTKPTSLANPDLRWETSEQLDFGFDSRFFNNSLSFSFDWFKKDTKDMLMERPIPLYVGSGSPLSNVWTLTNQGIELEVGYKLSVDKVNLSFLANASYVKNEIKNLGNQTGYIDKESLPTLGTVSRNENGYPIGYFFGYKAIGVFQTQEEIDSYISPATGKPIQPNAAPGDTKFEDLNGDGVISDDNEDRTMIGKPNPDWMVGLTVAADWNGFDLSAFFQGSFGADVFDALRRYELAAVNYTSDALERWTGPGTSNSMPRIVLGDTPKNFRPSTLLVHDASFLRLRNLQVGYTLPAQLTRKAYIQRLRFYASFDNLLTITGYKGMDPEIGSTMGIDKGVYPQARVYTFGLNLTF